MAQSVFGPFLPKGWKPPVKPSLPSSLNYLSQAPLDMTRSSTTAVARPAASMAFPILTPKPALSGPRITPPTVIQQQVKKQQDFEAAISNQEKLGRTGASLVGQTIGGPVRAALQTTVLPAMEKLGLRNPKAAIVPSSPVSSFFLGEEPIFSLPEIIAQGREQAKGGHVGQGLGTAGIGVLGVLADMTPGGGAKKKVAQESLEAAGRFAKGHADEAVSAVKKVGDEASSFIKNTVEAIKGKEQTAKMVDKAVMESAINQHVINKNLADEAAAAVEAGKPRKLPLSIQESNQFPPEVKARIGDTYQPITNIETTRAAEQAVTANPQAALQRVLGPESLDAVGFEQARLLTKAAIAEGRIDDAVEIIRATTPKATTAGQAVQSLSLWGEMTPEGALKFVQKEMDKFNKGGLLGGKLIPNRALTPKTAEDIANAANNIKNFPDGSDGKVNAVSDLLSKIQEALPSSAADKVAEWGRAVKLTSFRSVERNWLGSVVETVYSPAKRLVAGLVDQGETTVKGLLGKQGDLNSRVAFASDAAADISGRIRGIAPGFKNFLKAIVEEAPVGGTAMFEQGGKKAIKGKLGYIVRTPFRIMNDEMFVTMAREAELSVEANRAARAAGLNGAAHEKFIADFLKNPPAAAAERIEKNAMEAVFKEDLTTRGAMVDKTIRAIRFGPVPVGEMIAPFFKTPLNILKKWAREKSALALVSPKNISDIAKGGVAAQEAKAKMILGFGTTMGLSGIAMSGKITGRGPKDTNERQMLEAQGWRPYSVKIGDKYYSYGSLGEISLALGTTADAFEAISEYKKDSNVSITDLLARSSMAFGNNIYNQSFLTGVQDLLDAVEDPTKSGQFFSNMTAGMVVPTGVSDIARATDPVVRKPSGLLETLQSRIPGLSQNVSPVRDVFGERKTREGGPLAAILSPVQVSTEKKSKLFDMLNDLGKGVSIPKTTIGDRKLSREDADKFLKVTGQVTKEVLTGLAGTEGFTSLPASEQNGTIDKAISKIREVIRGAFAVDVEMKALGIKGEPDAEKKAAMAKIIGSKEYKALDEENKKRVINGLLGR